MLIPSIDLMGGRIVQLERGEELRLAFDDFEYWIGRFACFPLVQLIVLGNALGGKIKEARLGVVDGGGHLLAGGGAGGQDGFVDRSQLFAK